MGADAKKYKRGSLYEFKVDTFFTTRSLVIFSTCLFEKKRIDRVYQLADISSSQAFTSLFQAITFLESKFYNLQTI